jgi:hypothetical protein
MSRATSSTDSTNLPWTVIGLVNIIELLVHTCEGAMSGRLTPVLIATVAGVIGGKQLHGDVIIPRTKQLSRLLYLLASDRRPRACKDESCGVRCWTPSRKVSVY